VNRSFRHTLSQHASLAFALVAVGLIAAIFPLAAHAAEPTFAITGKGYGHGIGMSQWGAQGYAKYGAKTYDWILAHYYQGTGLAQRYTDAGSVVKVNLAKSGGARSMWVVRSGHSSVPLTVYDAANAADVIALPGTGTYMLTASASKVTVSDAVYSGSTWTAGAARKTFPGAVTVRSTAPTVVDEPALVTVKTASGPFDRTNVRWRGSIKFQPTTSTTLKAINQPSLEAYLYGVVPRESPSSWEAEALKAQAVAARSYAYPSASDGSILWCTTMSQVYHGHSRRVASGDGVAEMHEQATTNSAIDATRGRIVVYGSEPVTTFFFSASGGHTANIEDVWTTSAAKPYYKGVPDEFEARAAADAGFGLATSWGAPINLTGSALGAKVRAAGYGPTSTSAYISAIQVNKGVGGYVRTILFRWSNGQTTSMTGSKFRSTLALKSTNFSVGGASIFDRFQETDARLLYYGTWGRAADAKHSGGSYRYTKTAGPYVRARFSGTAIKWVTKVGPSSGKASVVIDGAEVAIVDLYSPTTKYRQTVWVGSGISDAEHTLEIRALGMRNPASTGAIVGVDAIDVPAGRLLNPLFDDTATSIAYTGVWPMAADAAMRGGSHHVSATGGSTISVGFSGTGITWIAKRDSASGLAEVWVDGQWKRMVDLYAPSTGYQQRVFTVSGLSATKRHLLRIRVRGEHSAASSDSLVSADAFEVIGGRLYWPAPARIQDNVSRIAYGRGWGVKKSSKLSGGSYHLATVKGASAKVRFRGTKIAWVTAKRPTSGKAAVYVDGKRVATVDLYSASTRYRKTVWSASKLSDGVHVLEIRVLHQKRAASTGYGVGVDAVDLLGDLLKP